MPRYRRVALAVALVLVVCSPLFADAPAVFEELSYGEALARATSENKLLVVDAMTSWCGPCKQMDRTTWIDSNLVSWLSANAVTIQLDMDQHPAIKEKLQIRAYPTIVAFRGGREFDRVVGYRSASQMREWLAGVNDERTELDHLKERLVELREQRGDVGERLAVARALIDHDEDRLATDELVTIWSANPRMRVGVLRWPLGTLAKRSSYAGERLSELRDGYVGKVVASDLDANAVREWLTLSVVLDDRAGVVDWVRSRLESDAGSSKMLDFHEELFPVLRDAGEWELAGGFLPAPLEAVHRMGQDLGAYDLHDEKGQPKKAGAAGGEATTEGEAATEDDRPKSLPAIPMGGMRPAAPKKALPAIPMGGMRPATPVSGGERSAVDIAREVRGRLTGALRERASEYYAALLAAGRGVEADAVARALFGYDDSSSARLELVARAIEAGVAEARAERHVRWLRDAALDSQR